MCEWIKKNLGDGVPIHFNRFSPTYKMQNLPPTPIKTLEKARDIAKEVGIKYIYIGNVPGHKENSTYCPNCKKRLVRRIHFAILENKIKEGKCSFCGENIPGFWRTQTAQ
jgi:pyruvate formate lyase activating enzyme